MSETSQREAEKNLQPDTYDFGRGKVEVFRSTPDHLKTNSETGEPLPPIFFQYGHGKAGVETADWYAKALTAATGREAIVVKYTGKRSKDTHPHGMGPGAQASQLDIGKAQDFLDIMEAMDIKKADMVAESAGAPRAVIAAAMSPQSFDNIVLVHPAGLDGLNYSQSHAQVVEHQMASLLRPKMMRERLQRMHRRKELAKTEEAVTNHPKGMSRAEQKAVAHDQLHTVLPAIKEENPNVKISIMADTHDFNFPLKALKELNEKNVDNFVTTDWGNHGIGHSQERVNEIGRLLDGSEPLSQREESKPKFWKRILRRPMFRNRQEQVKTQEVRQELKTQTN